MHRTAGRTRYGSPSCSTPCHPQCRSLSLFVYLLIFSIILSIFHFVYLLKDLHTGLQKEKRRKKGENVVKEGEGEGGVVYLLASEVVVVPCLWTVLANKKEKKIKR